MSNKPLLSIIVPVYNSEDYLIKAFDSVLNQDFDDFELILVDDGSTDRSGEICKKYVNKDVRVRLLSKRNGGLCSARNLGIENADGDYLMFMDNDDEYVSGAFHVIANAIHTYKTDIIRFNRRRIQIFGDETQKADVYGTKGIVNESPVVYSRKQFFDNYEAVRKSGCFAGIWNAAFKRDLFKNIRFDETIMSGGEDLIANIELYGIFQTVAFLPDVLYVYYRRANHSISTRFQINQILAMSKGSSLERRMLKENGIKDEIYLNYAYVYLAGVIKQISHKDSILTWKQKNKLLNSLREDSFGFRYELTDIKHSHISLIKKLYYKLYIRRNYRLLFLITNLIMKARGNI